MRILITTDSFPPGCGGSGWSTYELARGLRDRGHTVVLMQPRPGEPRDTLHAYDGFQVRRLAFAAPDLPFVRNYFKHERLTRLLEPRIRRVVREERIDIAHGQHVLTCPATVAAARAERVPVVCTVRDYWPICYWSDLIHDPRAEALCPACSSAMMTRCVRPRAGAAWPLALPMIPYMGATLRRKRRQLSDASAVVAVSTAIARDLAQRAPELRRTRIEIIPNPVDVAALAEIRAEPPDRAADPYAIYVGKLAPNKGVAKLFAAIERAQLRWPLVVVGDGPDRAALERLGAAARVPVSFTGWLDRDDALAKLRAASLLVFPSHGPESLSRVLLEASALGVPIAAMDTGGTSDIVEHDVTGLLARSTDELGDAVAKLAGDPALRARLGAAARSKVAATFDTPRVVGRLEDLYRSLLAERRA